MVTLDNALVVPAANTRHGPTDVVIGRVLRWKDCRVGATGRPLIRLTNALPKNAASIGGVRLL